MKMFTLRIIMTKDEKKMKWSHNREKPTKLEIHRKIMENLQKEVNNRVKANVRLRVKQLMKKTFVLIIRHKRKVVQNNKQNIG